MQALQGDARVMKREVSRFTRLTYPRQVRRGKCENRLHHGRFRSGKAQKSSIVSIIRSRVANTGSWWRNCSLRHHIGPQCELRCLVGKHFV